MRKIAVEQLRQLQRASASDDVIGNDVIADDVTSAHQVGDDGDRLKATNEPPQ